MATIVPKECLPETHFEKQVLPEQNFFDKIYSYFKYSPTSKTCLEYSEAIMINDFIKVTLTEVISYTIIQTVRPFVTSSGELFNEFYVGLAKDLSFYQYIPLFAFFSVVLIVVVVLVLVLCFCGEFSFFGLKLKKGTNLKVKEEEIEKKIMLQLMSNLVGKVPALKVGDLSVEGVTKSIKSSQELTFQEMKALKARIDLLTSTDKPAAITDGECHKINSKDNMEESNSVEHEAEMLGRSYDSDDTMSVNSQDD